MLVVAIASVSGCGLTPSSAAARTTCDYLTDSEFVDALAVTELARETVVSKDDFVALADIGCATPGPGVTSEQCLACLRAVADFVYGN